MNLNHINPKLNEGSIDIDALLFDLLGGNVSQFKEEILELNTLIDEFDFDTFFNLEMTSVNNESNSDLFITNLNKAYLAYFLISNKLMNLIELYNQVDSMETTKVKAIEALELSIKNKLSTIDSLKGIYKFIVKESYPFTNNQNNKFITLPVESEVPVEYLSYAISGNSVGTVTDTFSIESFNEKALLELDILFKSDTIVNSLIVTLKDEQTSPVFVDSIISNGDQLLPYQEEVKENQRIIFLPAQTSKLTIRFKSQYNNEQYSSINIQSINFSKLKYLNKQEILSSKILVNNKPSVVNSLIDVFGNDKLSNVILQVSLNGSEYVSNDYITYPNINSLVYKINLERLDDAFSSMSSYDNKSEYEYNYQQSTLSKDRFPNNMILNKKVLDSKLWIYYPKLFKLSYRDQGILLGYGTSIDLRLELPFELTYDEIKSATIKVDGIDWAYVDSLASSAATDKHWTVDKNNYKYIVFGDNTNGLAPADQSKIYFSLGLEKLNLIKNENGFISKLNHNHDPDPSTIKLYSVNDSAASGRFILPKSVKVIKLPHKNIVIDSLTITEKYNSGNLYSTYTLSDKKTFVDGSSELINAGDYSIDYVNGFIYSYSLTPLTTFITVNYQYYPVEEVSIPVKTIELDGEKVINIDEDFLKVKSYTDSVTGSSTNVTRLTLDGLVQIEQQTPTSSGNVFYLSRTSIVKGTVNANNLFLNAEDYIPEEVDYIDGVNEFYNLINVKEEVLPTYSSGGVVSFTLDGGSNYYSPLGITFSDNTIFASEQNSAIAVNVVGEWNITNGVVTVCLDTGMEGVTCSYSYKNDSFDATNKFSIDYKNSILYSLSTFKSTGTITYQSGNYFIGYEIVKDVSSYEIDSSKTVITIKEQPLYNNIKIAYPVSLKNQSLDKLKDYYSPLIKSIEFRFT